MFTEEGIEVAAGIRQPMLAFVNARPGLRLLEPRFMEIKQAVGVLRSRHPDTVGFLRSFIEEVKADGFIAEALRRSGRDDVVVAPSA